MRHADVCTCRDCGVARLSSIMDGMPDTEGKLVVAFAGLQVGNAPFDSDQVALPYPEVLAAANRMCGILASLEALGGEHLQDPHAGPFSDLVVRMEDELRVLTRAWKRE